MSQSGVYFDGTTAAGIETITGNSGGQVGPVLSGGTFTIGLTGTAPLTVAGNPGTHSLAISIDPTGYVASITGTANQIVASAATGAVTLSFPATAGLSIGTYQATVAPVGGIIMPGPAGFGTNSVAADYGLLVSYNKVLQIGVTGTSTSTDTIAGSVSTYGIAANPTVNPASGAAIAGGIIAYPTHIAPNGQTITRAVGVYASGTAGSNVGTITNQIGVYVDALGGAAGTVTNTYGGYFTNPGVGSNRCALYADNMSIGFAATAPVANGLIVSGSAAFGANSLSNAGDGVSIGYTASAAGTSLFALDIRPTYTMASGSASIIGAYINLTAVATGTISSAYSAWLSTPAFLGTLANITNYYGLRIDPSTQAIVNSTSLYVGQPTSATTNNICAAFAGGISIGSSYTTTVPPSNGSIIQGQVAIGTNAPYTGGTSVSRVTINMNSADTVGEAMTGTPTAVNASSSLYGYDMGPSFTPTNGATNVAGFYLEPIIIAPSAKTITTAAAIISTPFYTSNVGTISNAYSILIDSSGGAGTITRMTNLLVKMPTAGSTNICAAFAGGISVGTSYITTAPPSNGAIIQGNVGIGTSSATNALTLGTVNSSSGELIKVNGTSAQSYISFYNNATRQGYIGTAASGAGIILNADATSLLFSTNVVPIYFSGMSLVGIAGGLSIGSSYYTTLPPSSGLIVEGHVGLGTSSPSASASVTFNKGTNDAYGIYFGGNSTFSGDQYEYLSQTGLNPSVSTATCSFILLNGSIKAAAATTITSASGFHAAINWSTNAGTITTAYNCRIQAGTGGAGTITTGYGLYVDTPTMASTNITAFFQGAIKIGSASTGAGSAALGANCPAGTLTAPYTWIPFISSDGSAVWVPCWK